MTLSLSAARRVGEGGGAGLRRGGTGKIVKKSADPVPAPVSRSWAEPQMANPHLYHEGHDIGVDRRFLVNMGGEGGGGGGRLRGATTKEIADFQQRNGPLHGRDSNRRPSGKGGKLFFLLVGIRTEDRRITLRHSNHCTTLSHEMKGASLCRV